MPKDLGDVSPTGALCNSHTDLDSGYEHKNWPLAVCLQSSNPGEHCLRQSSVDKKAFVEVQEPNREVPAHCWNKEIRD